MTIQQRIRRRIERVRSGEGGDPSRMRRTYWACYTLCFAAAAFVVLLPYPANGTSMVWEIDGLEQFYPYFVFEGHWLREIADGLISGQGLVVPLWSHDLGYGADIIAELDVLFDPLNLLSGLCPQRYSEYLFQFLVVFRLYLAGAAFSLLALRFGCGRFPTLLAALLYALCGTALAVAHWPASAWPLILFPLALLGVERILAGRRPYLFVAAMTAFFVISYYFSYMACLFLVPYCAARVVVVRGRMGAGRFALWTLRFVGLLAIAVLLAGVVLAPQLIELSQNSRFASEETVVPLAYSLPYYATAVAGFVGSATVGSDCYIGYGGVALLACALLFMKRGEHRLLKLAFVALAAILLVPALGSAFNGFNYATNRWVWALALVVCFIVAKMLPNLLAATAREARGLAVAAFSFCALAALLAPARTEKTLAACVVLTATLYFVSQRGLSGLARGGAVAACLAAGLACNAFYLVSPEEGGLAQGGPRIGSVYDKLTDESSNSLVAGIDDDGAWRYDADPATGSRPRNDSLVLGLAGIDFYNSFYNGYIDAYHTELGVLDTMINFSYRNVGARSILETLAGVKYFLAPDGVAPPYNYRGAPVASGAVRGEGYRVYEAENPLPLAYVYDAAIDPALYESLAPVERQESLLQGVVAHDPSLPAADLDLESRSVPARFEPGPGLTMSDGVIDVASAGATLDVTFDGLADSETYLSFEGLNFRGIPPVEAQGPGFGDEPWYRKLLAYKQSLGWTEPLEYRIDIVSDKGPATRSIVNYSKGNHLYGGKSDWLANMGYAADAQTTMTITFEQAGEYTFDGLSVACQPMGSFDSRVDGLKATPVQDLRLGTNEVSASVEARDRCALFFSVPYSEGWSATVDGEPAKILRANTGFMAVDLDPGRHDVCLSYATPGLAEGAAATAAGLVALAALALVWELRSRRSLQSEKRESA